jgi:hypothetical protein
MMLLSDAFYFYRGRLIAAFATAVAATVLALVFWDDVFGSEPKPLACIVLDVSRSTRNARSSYSARSRDIVRDQSVANGQVCALAVKGDPAGESEIQVWDVGAQDRGNSSVEAIQQVRRQTRAAEAVDRILTDSPGAVGGSAIVEALNLIARHVRPGDSVHVFSDGIQDSARFKLRSLHRERWSDASLDRELDRLEGEHLIPALAGVSVVFETPGLRPGEKPSIVPDEDAHRFWDAWGERASARVTWGAVR